MFPRIDRYQQEAYRALMKIARQHGGAFLCDGVGLGKTFVGLMLIERLVLHEGKRVVLFAPKATKEGVWEPHLREWLPHIGGVGGHADFSNLAIFSHTDLGRKGDFPERFRHIAELADIVVILGYARSRQLEFWGQDGDESEDEDIVPPEMLDAVKELDREQYDVPAMITETFRDRCRPYRHSPPNDRNRRGHWEARRLAGGVPDRRGAGLMEGLREEIVGRAKAS